jgi:hypothetical protein
MTAISLHLRRKLARGFYTAGVIFLLAGLVLSLVNQPARAQSDFSFQSSSQLNSGMLQDEQPTEEAPAEETPEVTRRSRRRLLRK